MNNKREIEDQLAGYLRFRVTPVGNRKIEFLHFFGKDTQGKDVMLRVTATRPATQQECEMWDHMLGLAQQLAGMPVPDGGMKEAQENLHGIDAYQARDSLGNPRPLKDFLKEKREG